MAAKSQLQCDQCLPCEQGIRNAMAMEGPAYWFQFDPSAINARVEEIICKNTGL